MKREYETVIGLEVHAELSTKSKIYCSCENKYGAKENTQCCPVCMGLPGALPVLNQTVVAYAIKMGHALHCNINSFIKQDRKNYFYPDLPKAYQISQFDIPLCERGYLDFYVDGQIKKVRISRVQIEEDAGKLIHHENGKTFIDYNRCGVPLIEIVTEPDIRSSKEAREFLENIKTILQYLDISDCKMQEGSIRCDINVSVRAKGQTEYATRCEMKNINTFSGAMRAIEHESQRQISLLESGQSISQQTRKWDDDKGESFLLRSKEDSQDYRFFQEPDILPLKLDKTWVEQLKNDIPELPHQKIQRYKTEYLIALADAEIIARDIHKAEYFEKVVQYCNNAPQTVAHWILGDVTKICNEQCIEMHQVPIAPKHLGELISLVESDIISGTAAKKVFRELLTKDISPTAVVQEMNLIQVSDPEILESVVNKVINEFSASVNDYKNGKQNALGFLVGKCMNATNGKANPKLLNQILLEKLK